MQIAEETVWRTTAAMDKVGYDRLDDLEKRLADGTAGEIDPKLAELEALGAEGAAELIEAARPQYEQGRAIVRIRKELHEHIDNATRDIARAQAAMRQLWSDWGDIEFEDGHAATDRCLTEALHQLQCAQAVKPSDADGDIK